jgi:hypothetical protein
LRFENEDYRFEKEFYDLKIKNSFFIEKNDSFYDKKADSP